LQAIQLELKNKDGTPKIAPKTKQPQTRTVNLWKMWDPANEMGKGRGLNYYEPVKVHELPDGTVEITEQDGNRFQVAIDGKVMPGKGLSDVDKRGSPTGGKISKAYDDAPGTPIRFFGRGLVQLTWWNGYASTSAAMGWKLALLLDPEKCSTSTRRTKSW
jgi:hypothetical protein